MRDSSSLTPSSSSERPSGPPVPRTIFLGGQNSSMLKCSRQATFGENATQKLDFPGELPWIPTAPPAGHMWYYTQTPVDKAGSPAKSPGRRNPSPITPVRHTDIIASNLHHLHKAPGCFQKHLPMAEVLPHFPTSVQLCLWPFYGPDTSWLPFQF